MKSLTMIVLLFSITPLFAQNARFITSGSIVYEKTINLYGLIKQHIGKDPDNITQQGIDKYKESHPQFKKYTSTLVFNEGKTLYTPDQAIQEKVYNYNDPMAAPGNLVYTDIAAGTSTAQKSIYDELFLVKDSTRKINWRYTGETREIAGFTCRRANALIMDSVYVVAFYTEKIHVSGGPESFTGLPGMILGVALPYENVTWFAIKVADTTIGPNTVAPPKKGKSVNQRQLSDFLKEKMKTWGNIKFHERKVFLL